MNDSPFQKARWIWTAAQTEPVNAYAQFRTLFKSSGHALLRVSVSGNYAAYVNGSLAAFGQYTDFPDHKTYSETDISEYCRPGENELLIEVHYSGNDFSSHADGDPGLICEVADGDKLLSTTSSANWLSRVDTRFAQGERPKLFVSLNYNFEFDARAALPDWEPPRELPGRGEIERRPLPPLPARRFKSLREISREEGRIVYDAGEETTGLLDFEVAASSGARIEISHAEYLVDGRINPAAVNGHRNFTDTYICREGENSFFHPLRRFGGRFFELRITGKAKVRRFGLRPVLHDWPAPPFSCSDPLFEKAHEISVRTLRLCHHEKYENCPWREQSICAADARNQMLFGYEFWGNFDTSLAMLDLFAQGLKANGFIRAAVPMQKPLWIPVFTFHWMLAVNEHALHLGSDIAFMRYCEQIEWMFYRILEHEIDGLWLPPDDEARWDYAECVNLEFDSDPPNAVYNLYLLEAVNAMLPRFEKLGNERIAERLKDVRSRLPAAFVRRFWNKERRAFADRVNASGEQEGFLAVIQVLSLLLGLVPAGEERGLLDRLIKGEYGDVALPTMPYLIRLIHEQGTENDKLWLHEKIRGIIKTHLDEGATTWWEDISGKNYAGGGGSLCHGWSAFVAWYESAWLLGRRPVEDGIYIEDPWTPPGFTCERKRRKSGK